MAIGTHEVTCVYESEAKALESIRLLSRNGWTVKQRYTKDGKYYVVYNVPNEPEVTPENNPGGNGGQIPNP
ncbi:MAG: hypothetical protein HUK18_07465 [Bacteroidales bacterium]|nr:hypothetical protein [Bacteroidales bacterium]